MVIMAQQVQWVTTFPPEAVVVVAVMQMWLVPTVAPVVEAGKIMLVAQV
jgi:hypothetical protein